jgi:NAD-dependent deacetylase
MKIVAFTGAGMSKDSGLDTFRLGGLWDGMDVREVAYADRWRAGDESRKKMLDFYNRRRRQCREASPNAGHLALAELENSGHEVTIVTQNVDDLHERAGSSNVIHLHGELMKVRPESDASTLIEWTEDCNLGDVYRGSQLRPHVVWFGEDLPELERALMESTDPSVDILIIVGTTLEVGPANLCAFQTRAPKVIIVDPEPPEFGIADESGRWFGELRRLRRHPNVITYREGAATGVPKAIQDFGNL